MADEICQSMSSPLRPVSLLSRSVLDTQLRRDSVRMVLRSLGSLGLWFLVSHFSFFVFLFVSVMSLQFFREKTFDYRPATTISSSQHRFPLLSVYLHWKFVI